MSAGIASNGQPTLVNISARRGLWDARISFSFSIGKALSTDYADYTDGKATG